MRYVLAGSFCAAFGLSVLLVLAVRQMAVKVGFVDRPGGRKTHPQPVALGGGIAIGLAACLPLLAVALLSHAWARNPGLFAVPTELHSAVRAAAGRLRVVLSVLVAGAAMLLFGLWDDVRPFSPRLKLVAQFIIAGILAALVPEVRLTVFMPFEWMHVVVTTVWFVLLTNSFNLLDNTDGQSGTVAVLTGSALVVLSLQTEQYFVAGMLLVLLGATLGFLLFNLPPASVFMGDAGSMFIGYMLAVATTLCTFTGAGERSNPIFAVLVPLIVFAVPLYDSLSVIAIRLHEGRSLLRGDRSHFSHRLLRLGMGERMVLATIAMTVVATAAGATVPYGGSTWSACVPAVQALAVILVIVQLEMVAGEGSREGDGD